LGVAARFGILQRVEEDVADLVEEAHGEALVA
jgi:hypothetical protein